jgi:hypothetical protein
VTTADSASETALLGSSKGPNSPVVPVGTGQAPMTSQPVDRREPAPAPPALVRVGMPPVASPAGESKPPHLAVPAPVEPDATETQLFPTVPVVAEEYAAQVAPVTAEEHTAPVTPPSAKRRRATGVAQPDGVSYRTRPNGPASPAASPIEADHSGRSRPGQPDPRAPTAPVPAGPMTDPTPREVLDSRATPVALVTPDPVVTKSARLEPAPRPPAPSPFPTAAAAQPTVTAPAVQVRIGRVEVPTSSPPRRVGRTSERTDVEAIRRHLNRIVY